MEIPYGQSARVHIGKILGRAARLVSSPGEENEIETISFLSCQIEVPLFDTGFSCGAPSAAAQGWHQVARHMHNPNGIIGARSASQLAPDSVAAVGNELLCSSASLPSHCNQTYIMWSNIFVLDRILSPIGTLKRVLLKGGVVNSPLGTVVHVKMPVALNEKQIGTHPNSFECGFSSNMDPFDDTPKVLGPDVLYHSF